MKIAMRFGTLIMLIAFAFVFFISRVDSASKSEVSIPKDLKEVISTCDSTILPMIKKINEQDIKVDPETLIKLRDLSAICVQAAEMAQMHVEISK